MKEESSAYAGLFCFRGRGRPRYMNIGELRNAFVREFG
jgi:hypothetical protein